MQEELSGQVVADALVQLKDLLICWLKKIPAKKFTGISTKLTDKWYERFDKTKEYSDRYGKSYSLDGIRCAESHADISEIFSCLEDMSGLDIIGIFLCSKLAASHAEIALPLIS